MPIDIIALLETPISIKNISEIASVDKVKGLALGGADLSASLGSTMDWDSLLYARSKIVLEAAINNLFSIDSPFMNIDNLDALQEESKRSKAMGFNGKAAIQFVRNRCCLCNHLQPEVLIVASVDAAHASPVGKQ